MLISVILASGWGIYTTSASCNLKGRDRECTELKHCQQSRPHVAITHVCLISVQWPLICIGTYLLVCISFLWPLLVQFWLHLQSTEVLTAYYATKALSFILDCEGSLLKIAVSFTYNMTVSSDRKMEPQSRVQIQAVESNTTVQPLKFSHVQIQEEDDVTSCQPSSSFKVKFRIQISHAGHGDVITR